MMYTSRLFKLLLVALSMVCVAQATFVDLTHNQGRLVRRASPIPSDGSGSDTSSINTVVNPTDTTAPAETTAADVTSEDSKASETSKAAETSEAAKTTASAVETTAQATSTSDPQTSAAPETSSSDDSPAKTTSNADSSESAAASTDAPAPTSTSEDSSDKSKSDSSDDSSTADSKNSQETHSLITSTKIDIVTKTNSDGSKETMTSTSITTETPGLTSDGSSGSSSMSTKTRNTVIGVVVGIGGFIVLGVLGLVAWRIWGRRKVNEEADGLMDFNINNNSTSYHSGYGPIEKSEPGSAGRDSAGPQRNSPFQNTLDNYHQPTPVNASSNF